MAIRLATIGPSMTSDIYPAPWMMSPIKGWRERQFESSMKAKIANTFWPGADRFCQHLDFKAICVLRGMALLLLFLRVGSR
jgi:hypothetical protein